MRYFTRLPISNKQFAQWKIRNALDHALARCFNRAKRQLKGMLKKGLTQVSLLPDMYYCNGSSVTIAQLTVVPFIRYGNRSQKISHTDGTWISRYD